MSDSIPLPPAVATLLQRAGHDAPEQVSIAELADLLPVLGDAMRDRQRQLSAVVSKAAYLSHLAGSVMPNPGITRSEAFSTGPVESDPNSVFDALFSGRVE